MEFDASPKGDYPTGTAKARRILTSWPSGSSESLDRHLSVYSCVFFTSIWFRILRLGSHFLSLSSGKRKWFLGRAAVKCPGIGEKRNGTSPEWKNKSPPGSNEKLREMALKARWTPEAEETFNAIIEYLENSWTENEVYSFVQKSQ